MTDPTGARPVDVLTVVSSAPVTPAVVRVTLRGAPDVVATADPTLAVLVPRVGDRDPAWPRWPGRPRRLAAGQPRGQPAQLHRPPAGPGHRRGRRRLRPARRRPGRRLGRRGTARGRARPGQQRPARRAPGRLAAAGRRRDRAAPPSPGSSPPPTPPPGASPCSRSPARPRSSRCRCRRGSRSAGCTAGTPSRAPCRCSPTPSPPSTRRRRGGVRLGGRGVRRRPGRAGRPARAVGPGPGPAPRDRVLAARPAMSPAG